MFNLNRAMVLGNLTRDPEMRYTPNGQAVTSFAIATNRSWTDQSGNKQDQTEYHDVVAWGKLAEIASTILHKGQPAYVEGRLQTRSWEGQDGQKRQKTEIIAENLIALNARSGAGTGEPGGYRPPTASSTDDMVASPQAPASSKPATKPESAEITIEDLDDIPF